MTGELRQPARAFAASDARTAERVDTTNYLVKQCESRIAKQSLTGQKLPKGRSIAADCVLHRLPFRGTARLVGADCITAVRVGT